MGGWFDPRRGRLQWANMVPLHSSLGNRARSCLKKKVKANYESIPLMDITIKMTWRYTQRGSVGSKQPKEKERKNSWNKSLYSNLDSFLLSIGGEELFGQFNMHSKNFRLWNDKVHAMYIYMYFVCLFTHKRESYICLLINWRCCRLCFYLPRL